MEYAAPVVFHCRRRRRKFEVSLIKQMEPTTHRDDGASGQPSEFVGVGVLEEERAHVYWSSFPRA